jgi:26S proteasome regulatory subunit N1
VAYAGTEREEVIELLLPTLSEGTADMETLGVAAVSLGMVCVGTANADVTQVCLALRVRSRVG